MKDENLSIYKKPPTETIGVTYFFIPDLATEIIALIIFMKLAILKWTNIS
jgi:hypothetical protein